MNTDLATLKREVSELPDDEDQLKIMRLIDETQMFDRHIEAMRAKEENGRRKLRRKSLLAIPIFFVAAVGCMWYLTSALSDGYVTHRGQIITSANDPINFWFRLVWPAGGIVSCVVAIAYLVKFCVFTAPSTRQ